MNLNQLAKEISKREGKKVQVNIAQIKEILKIMMDILNAKVACPMCDANSFSGDQYLVFCNTCGMSITRENYDKIKFDVFNKKQIKKKPKAKRKPKKK